MRQRTVIGGLLLEIPDGWRFSLCDGVVAGRYKEDPGILRIATMEPNLLPQPLTHDRCLDIAMSMACVSGLRPIAQHLMAAVSGPFGAASFVRDQNYVRLWYCSRSAGLIIGTFGYPKELAETPAWKFVSGQCARMIFSAIFDRISWGADDELTRLLIEHLEAAELAASAPPGTPPSPVQSDRSKPST